MARSLRVLLLFAVTLGAASTLPPAISTARAGELDRKGKADAKEAMRLYKEGNYEDAAKVFSRLSIAYPEMLVFVRNLGACYYYLRRWEPAISNLRDYEHRKKDIAPDDRAEIAGWISEMERMRDQSTPPPVAAAPASSSALLPTAAAPQPVAPVASPPAAASAPLLSPGAGPMPPEPAPPAPPGSAATSSPGARGEAAAPPSAQLGQPPGYPSSQYGPQPSSYPPGQYGPQPEYPQAQYGAPPSGYPGAPYSSTTPVYPQGYPAGAYAPAGQVAAAPARSGTGRKVAAWILGIAGVGGIVAGVVCTAKALDDFSKVQKKYDPSLGDQGKKFAVAQWFGYGVGSALLVTAIIVGASGAGSSPGVALVPAVGSGTAGAALSGTF